MASMMETDPAMQRLFDRLDSAPRPGASRLPLFLAEWAARRGKRIAPSTGELQDFLVSAEAESAFVFESVSAGRDFTLRRGEKAVAALLGACKPGSALSDAPERRAAARLRRIFELVRENGEPLLADFTAERADGAPVAVEILAMPISEDGHRISGVFGGLELRADSEITAHHGPGAAAGAPMIFAFERDAVFAKAVAGHLGLALGPLEERDFEDGEHKARPLASVRGRDVYVVASLHGSDDASVNDRLCRLLFFIGALKTGGAARVTAVTPYLCYLRKDRQTKSRDPITSRYVAQLLEAVGTDRVITIEAHNFAALQNAFRVPCEHLDANALFAHFFAEELGEDEAVAVVSPDLGGAKRAEAFRERLEAVLGRPVGKGFMDKQRSMGKVTGELFAGDVSGRHAIVVDDLISSGTTMARVAEVCREKGASDISLVATHGLFSEGAAKNLAAPGISRILVTDSVPAGRLDGPAAGRIVVISVAWLFAEAIRRCHENGSIVELLGG
jgi:ribose-phosphate pyrophosphokinase